MAALGPFVHLSERDRKWWIVGTMSLASIMMTLDYYVLMVALPTIARDLRAEASITWVINAYLLALAACLIAGGRLGDLFGRRRLFLVGTVLFAAASAAGGLAQTDG